MNVKNLILHRLHMELNHPFTTSFGTVKDKDFFIVELIDRDGRSGFGESVAFTSPWYTEETTLTILHMIESFLIPLIREKNVTHPDEIESLFQPIKRNNMAKAALEGAYWDLYAKQQNLSLARALGGTRMKIPVGISLGMEEKIVHLLKKIDYYASEGYKRVKLKVNRERDLEILREVRRHFPELPLMVDANSDYTLDDIDHLKRFDEFQLMMIEQPLASDDILEHAILQQHVTTPICLDESIHSLTDVKMALELGSCKIINIKAGRVGGLSVAKKIHDYCQKHGIAVWVGGMLDSGVGRAHNIALASLPNFTLPGDIGASSHYWKNDIITPEVVVENGMIQLVDSAGIGYEINREILKKFSVDMRKYTLAE